MGMKGICLLGLLAAAAWAQDGRPAYEAATVKVNNSASRQSSSNGSRGQVLMSNQSLRRLIERAYQIRPMQLEGPGWLDDVHFDIAAKYPEGAKMEDRWTMLRTLLEDRFKLAAHKETKEMPGYSLVVAKGGFKLKPVETAGPSETNSEGGLLRTLSARRVTTAKLADFLARDLNAFVMDGTGISGVYNFDLKYAKEEQGPGSDADPAPTIFMALEERLGLRLKAQKVPVDMIVVDHVERTPVEN
jgi:uncharacterized protein (TIGR03435 family)